MIYGFVSKEANRTTRNISKSSSRPENLSTNTLLPLLRTFNFFVFFYYRLRARRVYEKRRGI